MDVMINFIKIKDEEDSNTNENKYGRNYVQHLDRIKMAEEPKETL